LLSRTARFTECPQEEPAYPAPETTPASIPLKHLLRAQDQIP
jgi:hypothetical protein